MEFNSYPSTAALSYLLLLSTTVLQLCCAKYQSELLTCKTNEDCRQRYHDRFKSYKFVCCATVLCDENYGNYYIVHSGCTTERHCKPEVKNGGTTGTATTFAARMLSSSWLSEEKNVEDNCVATRNAFPIDRLQSDWQEYLRVEAKQPPKGATEFVLEPYPPKGECDESDCAKQQGRSCCLKINCIDADTVSSLSRRKIYERKAVCLQRCRNRKTPLQGGWEFYLTADTWARRSRYMEEMLAPDPAVSNSHRCEETRFFYSWASTTAVRTRTT